MSNRERWIVYPLLFFAVLASLKNGIAPPHPLECRRLECQSLVLKSNDGRNLVTLSPSGDGAALRFYGPHDEFDENQPKVDRLQPPKMRQVVELGSNDTGGYATLFGPETTPVLKLGHHPTLSLAGLIATDKEGTPFSIDLNASDADVWGPLIGWEAGKEKKELVKEEDASSEESASGGEEATEEPQSEEVQSEASEGNDNDSDEQQSP